MGRSNAKWAALSVEARKRIVIETLQGLSSGGRGVSMNCFNGRKPHWVATAQLCASYFGGWPQANIAAGLTPLRPPGADKGSRKALTEKEMGPVVKAMSKVDILNSHKRPLVVKANDNGRPYRYWDPNMYVWRNTTIYGGGRFEHSAANSEE